MDFSFSDEQQALAELARRIFEDHAEPDRMRALETADAPLFDPILWRALADAYVDTEAIRLTSRQAAWRLADGRPAAEEVAIAKYWAAAGGQRVVHSAVHLHGGIGVDRDYPLHRYFLLAKRLELELGGTSRQLLTIGALLANEPAPESA